MSAALSGSPDTLAQIERMLHERIGLDPSTVGSSLVHRAVHRRMQTCGTISVVAYAARLFHDSQEVQELVEEVVIPETYFFREPEALDAVARRIASGAAGGTTDSPLRILSAPCSTGEEPYSIAMSLASAGVAWAAFAIDAVDVSFDAIRRARIAVYRGGSFRGGTDEWRQYFDETPQGFALHAIVRTHVRLVQGNLLDAMFRPPCSTYDIIFCRNLLIYFDANTQARLLSTLTALLAPDGVLVVGAADTFAVRRAGYVPVAGAERSFLFQHRPAAADAVEPREVASRSRQARPRLRSGRQKLTSARPATRDATATHANTPAADAPRVPEADSPSPLVIEIARLAGAGRLVEAVRLGEGALTATGADAELLALMGTTYAALLDVSHAEACYRRALYLDPSHADALTHLALLLDDRGDSTAASRLRARARRGLDGSLGGAT